MNLDMTMFHQAFFEEAGDLLADFEANLLTLEDQPNDPEVLNTIFRCAHSIKGGSATFGFGDIAHFTHGLETLLDRLRNGEIQVDSSLSQLLFESLDQLKALLSVAKGEMGAAPDSAGLTARIDSAISEGGGGSAPAGTPPAAIVDSRSNGPVSYRLRFAPSPDTLVQGGDPLHMLHQALAGAQVSCIELDTSAIPTLHEMDPERCYLAWNVEFSSCASREDILSPFEFIADESTIELNECSAKGQRAPLELPEPTAKAADKSPEASSAPAAVPSQAPKAAEAQTLRVTTDKIDKLINLVGELVINQSMLNEVIQNFEMTKMSRLVEAVAQMERASRELQERVMAVRMLPIKHAFGRFPRLVRDLASSCGKKIELVTSGEETELDKTVIEAIADPLTHLVRNSIDHGLEPPKERTASGKSETGTISLHASQEGGSIVVEISDDGRGLNRERILAKAIERGLTTESDSAGLTDEAAHAFIFQPGFSTAAQVTDLSGRGVGMDIVRQAVLGLGGNIGVTSVPGRGSKFRIKLPLTMAILEGLSVSVGSEVYIMSLTSIVESIQPKPNDVRLVLGREEVVQVRGEVLPIVRLHRLFGVEPQFTDPCHALLVIVENEGNKVALLVDELIGQSQIVIKSLESNYRKVDGLAGATILGDGRVALILDIPSLVAMRQSAAPLRMAA